MVVLKKKNGFTLVELLVALSVSSIILAAVATLAYAFGRAREGMGDISRTQSYVRYTTKRISDLVREAKLVCYTDSDCFAIWRADDNEDGKINIAELVYVDKGDEGDSLRLCEFSSSSSAVVNLSSIGSFATGWWMAFCSDADYTVLVPGCSSIQFGYDVAAPWSECVTISFELTENGIVRQYEISSHIRAIALNLLNSAGDAIVSDDD